MAKNTSIYWPLLLLLFLLPRTVTAENVYIDDKIMVGLHQDQDIDSAIIKLLPGGTALEVIKRDTALTQVKEPGGASGWIDNHYLVDTLPGRARAMQMQEKITKLETELAALKTGQNVVPAADADSEALAALRKTNEELKQQLQSAQLKAGEYQAQVAELRNKLSRETTATDRTDEDAADNTPDATQSAWQEYSDGIPGWRVFLIMIAVCLVIGLIGGAWLMDWYFRSRHGGFRV